MIIRVEHNNNYCNNNRFCAYNNNINSDHLYQPIQVINTIIIIIIVIIEHNYY